MFSREICITSQHRMLDCSCAHFTSEMLNGFLEWFGMNAMAIFIVIIVIHVITENITSRFGNEKIQWMHSHLEHDKLYCNEAAHDSMEPKNSLFTLLSLMVRILSRKYNSNVPFDMTIWRRKPLNFHIEFVQIGQLNLSMKFKFNRKRILELTSNQNVRTWGKYLRNHYMWSLAAKVTSLISFKCYWICWIGF